MFERFKTVKKNHPESLVAANWWSTTLLDDKVRFYSGNICLVRDKKSVPDVHKVALFSEGIKRIVDSYLEDPNSFIDLKLSSSSERLVKLASEVDIDDFESHFGNGAIMYVSSYEGVTVLHKGQKEGRKL